MKEVKKDNVRSSNFTSNGRFAPGNNANPKGSNQFTTLVPLLEALKQEGRKRHKDFWEMVAQKAYTNDTILVAILKKLVADKREISGDSLGQVKIIIVRPKEDADARIKS